MPDLSDRLVGCFLSVFPDLSDTHVRQASSVTTTEWDSIAVVNLISVIEEEFGLTISPDAYEELTSFYSVLGYLQQHVA